jgi:hypothetical protein
MPIFANKYYVAMAGDANPAEACRTWKFTTNNFAAIPAKIRSAT